MLAPVWGPFEVVETHISRLLFVDDRVLKWYRPLATEFLDHRDVAARRRSMVRELELNRRFAPDVYLDVASVRTSGGDELEPVLVMRRLPASRRLSSMLDAPEASAAVGAVARLVASAHAASARSPDIDAFGSPDAVLGGWLANLDELAHVSAAAVVAADRIDVARAAFVRWCDGRERFLEHRVDGGWIVDGHGDLLCDDIFVLDDGPRVLDCLAFRDDFRYGDVAADLAFLAMDLDRRGHPELVAVLADSYGEHRGHPLPRGLLAAWTAHRAFIRAKVALIRVAQGDESAAAEAEALFAAGERHQRRAEPIVVLVGGAPGTGKTTTARGLAERIGATVLRTDEVRKELAGLDVHASAAAEPGRGLYGSDWTDRTYREVMRRAEVLVEAGERVVLDASWSASAARGAVRARLGARARLVELRCDAPPTVADDRVRHRTARERDASDADAGVAAWMRSHFEPWPESVTLDTTVAIDRVVDAAVAICRA